jgi:hypothetical protein
MSAEFSGMSERHAGRLADGHGLRFGRSARKGASSCIAALAACGARAGQLAAEPLVHSPVAVDYDERGLVNSLRWTLDCRVHGATSITLNRAENASDTIMRSEIETLSSTGRSIMPEGMEQQIDPQRVAELLTYLPATP